MSGKTLFRANLKRILGNHYATKLLLIKWKQKRVLGGLRRSLRIKQGRVRNRIVQGCIAIDRLRNIAKLLRRTS